MAWSEEARQAALEARRAAAVRKEAHNSWAQIRAKKLAENQPIHPNDPKAQAAFEQIHNPPADVHESGGQKTGDTHTYQTLVSQRDVFHAALKVAQTGKDADKQRYDQLRQQRAQQQGKSASLHSTSDSGRSRFYAGRFSRGGV